MSNLAMQVEEPEYHTDLSVGEILRRTRLHYGQSLEQVEAVLRIRASQLEAIELGDLDRLPGKVYAIGFVRSYSEYLGLDGDKMVRLFKAQSIGGRISPELHFPVAASESKVPNLYMLAIALAGIIAVTIVWSVFLTPDYVREEIPTVPTEMQVTQKSSPLQQSTSIAIQSARPPSSESLIEPAAGEMGPPQPETLPEAEPEGKVILKITENSWIEIRNAEGSAILRQVLKPGDQYTVPDEDGLILSTGNAGGIVVLVDGKELPPLGKSAEVRRNLSLNADELTKPVEN